MSGHAAAAAAVATCSHLADVFTNHASGVIAYSMCMDVFCFVFILAIILILCQHTSLNLKYKQHIVITLQEVS